MFWYDKLNVLTTDDIRHKITYIEKEIREANIEIVQATKHRDSLKTELKREKLKIASI
jgi:septal ring factor EnvC (AmiA/AmiB activator)